MRKDLSDLQKKVSKSSKSENSVRIWQKKERKRIDFIKINAKTSVRIFEKNKASFESSLTQIVWFLKIS